MPSVHASLAVAALAGVLALASTSGSTLLACAVVLVILIFTLGAVSSTEIASSRWAGMLASLSGIGALVWTYLDRTSDLTPMGALLGPTIVISIVVQLWRSDGRPALTASLTLTITACVLAVLPATWVALRESVDGPHSVGLALLGVGTVGLAEALPVSRAGRRVFGVLAAVVAAGVLVMTVDQVGDPVPAVSALVVAAFAGLMAGIAFAVVDRLAHELATSAARVSVRVGEESDAAGATAGEGELPAAANPSAARGAAALLPLRVSLPFIAAAPAAYVLGRIFIG